MNFYNQPIRKFTRIIHYTYSIVQIQYCTIQVKQMEVFMNKIITIFFTLILDL